MTVSNELLVFVIKYLTIPLAVIAVLVFAAINVNILLKTKSIDSLMHPPEKEGKLQKRLFGIILFLVVVNISLALLSQ